MVLNNFKRQEKFHCECTIELTGCYGIDVATSLFCSESLYPCTKPNASNPADRSSHGLALVLQKVRVTEIRIRAIVLVGGQTQMVFVFREQRDQSNHV